MKKLSSVVDHQTKKTAGNTALTIDLETGSLPYYRKFEMVAQFVFAVQEVLNYTDPNHYGEPYISYHAMRHIMKNAFIDYPVPGVNYEQILISRGHLWNTHKAMAKAVSDTVVFSWTNDAGVGGARWDDQCIMVAYCETLNKCVFMRESEARHWGEAQLAVPDFRSHKVHTWLGFISADSKRVSNSIYTGAILVT